jgi:glucose-6-phosphate 1-dehydrogenase
MKQMPDIPIQPTQLVIFGAGGDLTWRKLIPAVYNLFLDNLLPEKFAVIGVDGKQIELEGWRKRLRDGVDRFSRRGKADPARWKEFTGYLTSCQSGNFNETATFSDLAQVLEDQDKDWGEKAVRVFYLATPPSVVEMVVQNLDRAHLTQDEKRTRVVVEKPFGSDLDSARTLNQTLLKTLDECQIYRIDHYLGKETVQNILAFRFANALFEPIWDRRYIDHVQITVAESVGVEHRGEYYEKAGALRDMVQNHLMQILCLVAMEPPVAFDADEIRARKVDVLRAVRPIDPENVHRFAARGQYASGWLAGEVVPAYREESSVDPESTTETFAALKLFVDNWRWQDVPFYLRTGKRLPLRFSQAVIQFRPVPHQSFPTSAILDWQPNRLVIQIQPHQGIYLRFQAKHPGVAMRLSPVDMYFSYDEAFEFVAPEAYETLILDVIRGDATLFMRADQVELAWQVITPVLESWQSIKPLDFPNYSAGTWGPESAEALIAQDGRSWQQPMSIAAKEKKPST